VSSPVVTGRHRSSPVVTFWSSPVVTGRHFWSKFFKIPNLLKSKFIKIHKRSASPLRFSIAAAVQHRLPAAAAAELGRCGDGKGGMGV